MAVPTLSHKSHLIKSLACATLLSACAVKQGTLVTQGQIDGFTPEATTCQEIMARLGPPDAREVAPNGAYAIAYQHAELNGGPFIVPTTSLRRVAFGCHKNGLLATVGTQEVN